jgi:MFS transporter, DHA1 family, multidrug resistance protein
VRRRAARFQVPIRSEDQSVRHNVRFFILLGLLAAGGPAAMDMYIPALPTVATDLGASTSAAQLTVGLYLVGLAAGQLVFGQWSDVAGRRRPLLIGLGMFVVASAVCGTCSSLPALCGGRFLQGASGAAGMVIGRAVVRDLFGLTASARYYSRLTIIYGTAPLVAPLIGAQILRFTSWHGIFLAISAFGAVLFVAAALLFPETHPAASRTAGDARTTGETFLRLLRHRRFLGCTVTIGLTMAALVAYVATATFVVQDGYGGSPQLFAGLFGLNALLMIVGNQVNAHLLPRYGPRRLIGFGLSLLLVAAIGLVVVGLGDLDLVALEACFAGMFASWGFVQGNVLALALSDHPDIAGAGSALIGLAQYAVAGLAAPLAGLGTTTSVLPLAIVTLTCAVAAGTASFVLIGPGRPKRAAAECELSAA